MTYTVTVAPPGALAGLSQGEARARAYQLLQMRFPPAKPCVSGKRMASRTRPLDPSIVPLGVWPHAQEPEVAHGLGPLYIHICLHHVLGFCGSPGRQVAPNLAVRLGKLRLGRGPAPRQGSLSGLAPVYPADPCCPIPCPTLTPSARGPVGRPHPACPLTLPGPGWGKQTSLSLGAQPCVAVLCGSHCTPARGSLDR